MKYFPKYRIYSIIGWGLPIVLSYFVSGIPDIHWILRVVLFIFLCPVFFFSLIILYMIVGKLWNKWKRKKGENDSKVSEKG